MEIIIEKRKPREYLCECCNFTTIVKRDFNNHLLTKKHQDKQEVQQYLFICNLCNKKYKNRSGLWKHSNHSQKCNSVNSILVEEQNNYILPEKGDEHILAEKKEFDIQLHCRMMSDLLKQNNELQKQIIELAKEPKIVNNYNNNNNTNNNTTNNQFNLNMFLNEECKNALNIDDFMDSLQLTVEDLEQTGELGFVQGMTRIFLKGLEDLDITMRPFHCTDIKRETVYIKDQDKWEKETTEKKLMKQALNQVVRKNLKMIHVWRENHPDYLRSNTKDNDEYNKISVSSLGSAYDDEQLRMDEKIIRNVLKEVILDRKANS
jgi:hypothetical protein